MRTVFVALGLIIASSGLALNAQQNESSFALFGDGNRGGGSDRGGLVYVMTNDSNANEILVFARDRRGRLLAVPGAAVRTGGSGGSINAPFDPLGSQNSLVHDDRLGLLFAVNAGDNSVSAFETERTARPRRTTVVASGGLIPVSLAVSDNRLYVLNAGGRGAVTTFAIGLDGQLTPLGTLDLGLSNGTSLPFNHNLAPGQVGVDALARRLIVVNAGGQELLVADLNDEGIPVGPLTSTPTPGPLPFTFDISRHGSILVAEASGSVSAFDPPAGAVPLTVTASAISTGQAASCWIVAHDNGFAFVSNTLSNAISLYRFTRTGRLELVNGVAAKTGGAPTDITLAAEGRFLYSLNAGTGDITGFAIDPDNGHLTLVETQRGLPANLGIQGIAAREF